jgi:chromosome segregation ATPase
MPDGNSTESHTPGSEVQGDGSQGTPEKTVPHASYAALQTTLNAANTRIKELEGEQTGLKTQLSTRETELAGQIETLKSQLAGKEDEFSSLQGEFKDARTKSAADALELAKFRMISKNFPQLATMAEAIPTPDSEEGLEPLLKSMAQAFGEAVTKATEQRMEGVVGISGSAAAAAQQSMPSDEQGWLTLINSLEDGSQEKAAAWDNFWAFVQKNGDGSSSLS